MFVFSEKQVGQRISNEEKDRFLLHLSEGHEDWQIKQADYAIKLYNHFLLKKYRSLKPELKQKEQWKSVQEKTIWALRLK